jgi:recombination protein RecT
MAENQQVAKSSASLQAYLRSDEVQQRIEKLLGDRGPQFITSLMSVVNNNIVLQDCTKKSVLSAAITAAGLDLPVNPNLGHAYIIPYRNKKKDANGKFYYEMEATFQIGAKGFKQLALRSGQYKLINSTDVREGEYKGENRLTGELAFEWVEDDTQRAKLPIIGYVSYFELRSGFKNALYMTVAELKAHAKQYSKSYQKGYGQWVDDFDSMARKTVMKLNISRDGITSTQLQTALLADQAAVEEDSYNYVDNEKDEQTPAAEPAKKVENTVKEQPAEPTQTLADALPGDGEEPSDAQG